MIARFFRKVYLKLRIVFFACTIAFVVVSFAMAYRCISRLVYETGLTPQAMFHLVFDNGADLQSVHGRVNILILGVAGGDHAGADLTDTILVLSFRIDTPGLAMISVPRDIWSETLKDKVNSAYHYGELKKPGGGIVLAKAIISDIIGLPLQYGIVFDFRKFKTIIDAVNGVDIDVPTAFTDETYPVEGRENDDCDNDPLLACRYQVLHVDAGVQHMDGERALAYARSRHALGAEGSDFARSQRQRQIILALREKLMMPDTYWPVVKVRQIVAAFQDATDTDMNIMELATVAKLFIVMPQEDIRQISIQEFLYEPPIGMYGRYVLLPRVSFEVIHEEIRKVLK